MKKIIAVSVLALTSLGWALGKKPYLKELSVNWVGKLPLRVTVDKNRKLIVTGNYEMGLREDGVVVWREAKLEEEKK